MSALKLYREKYNFKVNLNLWAACKSTLNLNAWYFDVLILAAICAVQNQDFFLP